MLFSSITFLYYFLPLFLICYFAVPKKLKNSVLLIASLVFYAWGEPKYVVLMLISILSGYIFGLLIEMAKTKQLKRVFLSISVVLSILMLGIFKYTDFFIGNFNAVTGLSVPLLRIALPIGISFYTFQILSYTIDVYRKNVVAQKNLINFAAYVAMFPQLIAGPIVRYSDIEKELTKRTHSFEKAFIGIRRFVFGLSKKVLIANLLGELCNIFRESNQKSVVFYWIYAISFTLHIYFDFSGYSDMAIGLGKILGFNFPENFNFPYISKSITEFWRRWHISLGTWFKDYVYIPLGGNRVSSFRRYFNIFVVWMLTGFWHGAAWNFIIWGLNFAFILILEKLLVGRLLLKTPKLFSHIYVLVIVILSFVIFNANSLNQAVGDISGIFGLTGISFTNQETLYYLKSYIVIILTAVILSTPFIPNIINKLKQNSVLKKIIFIAEPVFLVTLLLIDTAYLVDGSFNPFLYFRF